MTKAYLNYPNGHMTLHGDAGCGQIAKMRKPTQRVVEITRASFTQTLEQLIGGGFRLGSKPSINDVWLSVDFGDAEFEEAVARYVYRLLGVRYRRLQGTRIKRHHC